MQVVTAGSMLSDERDAVEQLAREILKNGRKPAGVCFYFQKSLSPDRLRAAALEFFPGIPIVGMSTKDRAFDRNVVIGSKNTGSSVSAGGVSRSRFSVNRFEEPKVVSNSGVIALAFAGDDVSLGSFAGVYADDKIINSERVFNRISKKAGLCGVFPDLIMFHCTEDAQIPFARALAEYMGDSVQVAGGMFDISEGEVSVFTEEGVLTGKSIYIMTFLYTDCDVLVTGESSSEPEGHHGVVTAVSGEVISEIDNQPAADVFFRWLDRDISSWSPDKINQELFRLRSQWTIASQTANIRGTICFNITYPVLVNPDHSLRISNVWEKGMRVCLMAVSSHDIVRHFGRVRCPSDRTVQGALHYMCDSYSSGERESVFFDTVVAAIRGSESFPFVTVPQHGEFAKDMDNMEFIMDNYVISSVWFLEKDPD
ncbi:FIST N-terminal domain-containing protein [Succinimonas amylolytica]|uniref:FIST N-terminal domain-containing protein n=1 Tax=Succinimonas amylolytica TaxID=83769 RepID=UPI0003677D64|nr:FIST N-terminal domain-containing protein [Succinimonas amylolytica]